MAFSYVQSFSHNFRRRFIEHEKRLQPRCSTRKICSLTNCSAIEGSCGATAKSCQLPLIYKALRTIWRFNCQYLQRQQSIEHSTVRSKKLEIYQETSAGQTETLRFRIKTKSFASSIPVEKTISDCSFLEVRQCLLRGPLTRTSGFAMELSF